MRAEPRLPPAFAERELAPWVGRLYVEQWTAAPGGPSDLRSRLLALRTALQPAWPLTERGCRSDFRPPLCGSRAVRALEVKIRGFVRCDPQAKLSDGSLSAVCYVDGNSTTDPPVDLGAWLIEQGLAVAGPGAPFEYQTLERIAQVNRRGVWGFQVDQIIR